MRVLIVGAGALGQVFGARLARGGVTVGYLVRPGKERWAADGPAVFRLRRRGRPVAEPLRPDQVITDAAAAGGWDMVWLCVPSTALRGSWTAELRAGIGGATVVTIGQDPHDLAVLAATWPREQIVQAVPTLLAYQAPLAGEVPAPGIAYWVPPGTAMAVTGAEERARQVIAALRAGGLRAKRSRRDGAGELMAARMLPYVAALEIAGWRPPGDLRPATGASREAVAVVAALGGGRPPRLAVPAWAAALALRLLPGLVPFDLPRYLESHFTKVGAQTRLMLDGWIAEGDARDLPVSRLKQLRHALASA